MAIRKKEIIDAFLRGQQQMTASRLIGREIKKDTKYTFELGGGRLQFCKFCRAFTENGRDWGECNKLEISVHKDAHCKRLVVKHGISK